MSYQNAMVYRRLRTLWQNEKGRPKHSGALGVFSAC